MKRILLAVAGLLLLTSHAYAADTATVVPTCSAQAIPIIQGISGFYIDETGDLCTSAGSSSANASVGTNGAAAPGSSTQVGTLVGGNLQPASPANPVPVAPGTGAVFSTNSTQVNGAAISSTNGMNIAPTDYASTDASGTVATGGTFQSVFASSTTRKSCQIQNPVTATETLTVRQGATTQFDLVPGAIYTCNWGTIVASDQIFVTAATSTHAFRASSQ